MSRLRETQAAMRAALHDGEPAALLELMKEKDPARVEVYRSMYWARQAESLADDFPAVQRLLGEALFERVAFTHVRRHPSRAPSLAALGRDLDETLTHLGQTTEAAVARLEWARVDAFWSPRAEVATPAALGALGERFAEAVLVFHPSVRLLELPRVARALAAGGDAALMTAAEEAESLVVWRRGLVMSEVVVERMEWTALRLAHGGASVAAVCEAFLEAAEPSAAATGAIVRWVTSGWISEVRPPDE